jgi:hypothetical protein
MSFQKEVWTDLSSIDCGDFIEKKNGLSYLSWAHAYQIFMDRWADNEIEFREESYEDGTVMMFCKITIFGGKNRELKAVREMFLPVLDFRNKAIVNPNAFARNTARQRVFTKCLSMHGLGSYIYAGEDMPASEKEAQEATISDDQVNVINEAIRLSNSDIDKFLHAYNIKNISELTVKQYDLALKQLNKKLQNLTFNSEVAK